MLGDCLACGDFNARTSNVADFIEQPALHQSLNLPPILTSDKPGPPRLNQDPHKLDNHGQKLIDMCKSLGVCILNGRTLGDTMGSPTCYWCAPSTIDYFLASSDLMDRVLTMQVLDLQPESIHCPIAMTLATGPYNVPDKTKEDISYDFPSFKWKQGDEIKFQETLMSNESVIASLSKLSPLLAGEGTSDQVKIDTITTELSEILISTAHIAGVLSKKY